MADPRRYTLSTKVNKSELATVRARLATSKLGQSEALRLLILNERLPERVHVGIDITAMTAYRNLQPLQSNLNQIAHELNADRTRQIPVEGARALLSLVRKIEAEVKAVRQDVIQGAGESP